MKRLPWKIWVSVFEIVVAVFLLAFTVNIENRTGPTRVFAVDVSPERILSGINQNEPLTFRLEEIKTEQITLPLKDSYIIAFYGDSMIETMGGGLPYVYKELKAKYPDNDFVLYNYGIGAENLIEATSRFNLPYNYKDRNFPPINELGADIIVIGSYSYNPIVPFDKNEQWVLLSDLINRTKAINNNVYLLAEQAPIKDGFGEGIGGVNWPPEIANPHVDKIVAGLNNAIGLAEALDVGLINVYEESKMEDGYGSAELVAVHDGIHYSEEGQELSAKVIADIIGVY